MSLNFDALFNLHRLIVYRISFYVIKNDDFETTLKQLKFNMSIKSILIVSEKKNLIKVESWIQNSLSLRKHYSQRLVVKNSKFSTCFSIYDFEFALNELNVKNSTTSRKWCERFVLTRFFFFTMIRFFNLTFSNNFVKFSRWECNSFFLSTFRRRYRVKAFFVSEEHDLEKKTCS
jgi:hypothetical protein